MGTRIQRTLLSIHRSGMRVVLDRSPGKLPEPSTPSAKLPRNMYHILFFHQKPNSASVIRIEKKKILHCDLNGTDYLGRGSITVKKMFWTLSSREAVTGSLLGDGSSHRCLYSDVMGRQEPRKQRERKSRYDDNDGKCPCDASSSPTWHTQTGR